MNKKYLLIGSAIVVLIVAAITYNYYVSNPPPAGNYTEFAKCLSERNATMYGAEWCHVCQTQKGMFGDSFAYVNYVECPQNTTLCTSKGVSAYPTWEINGRMYEGLMQFQFLSIASGCPLNK